MMRFIQVVLCLVLASTSIRGGEDDKKKEPPTIEEALNQVPEKILELLEKSSFMENRKLPALPDEVKEALKSIDTENPDWKAHLALVGYKTYETIDWRMYNWIANDHNRPGSEEWGKRYSTNEVMNGLSCVYAEECPKIPVEKNEYQSVIDTCLKSKCELKSRTDMSPHVGGMSGLALVFTYKQLPRFILGIGCPMREKFGGGGGPYHYSIHLYDLKQDLAINKVVWVDQYEMFGEKADKAAIEFWEKLEVGVWVSKRGNNNERLEHLEDIEKGGFGGPIFIPKKTAPNVFAIEDYVAAVHRWNYNGYLKWINEHQENIKKLEEQIKASDNPEEKDQLLAEKEKEIAEMKKKEAKLPELKKRIEIIDEYIRNKSER